MNNNYSQFRLAAYVASLSATLTLNAPVAPFPTVRRVGVIGHRGHLSALELYQLAHADRIQAERERQQVRSQERLAGEAAAARRLAVPPHVQAYIKRREQRRADRKAKKKATKRASQQR